MHGQEDGETGPEARTRKASSRIPEGALGRTLRCAPAISSSPKHFPSGRKPGKHSSSSDVTINGARGRMIVDTGASMVSMTQAFAARARIMPDESNPITFQVVGGTHQSAPG
ncbi:retropepsin-like aspartic protease [Bradyrhizobium sp. USDA 3397]